MSIDSTTALPGVAGRGLHALETGDAVQLAFVALLGAELADVLRAPVVGLVLFGPVGDELGLALVDAPDVADHVAGHLAVGVLAQQARAHVNAGEAVALRGESRHLHVGQAGAQWQRVEAVRLLQQFAKAALVAWRDLHQLAQAGDGGVHVLHARRRDLQRIGRVVGGQNAAFAVQDLPPVGHHRQHGRAVALGLRSQVFVADHLEVDHARGDQPEREHHREADQQCPGAELRQIGFDVADLGHDYRGLLSSGLGARRCGASSSTLTTGQSAASITGASR
jgi:hypothetical protein